MDKKEINKLIKYLFYEFEDNGGSEEFRSLTKCLGVDENIGETFETFRELTNFLKAEIEVCNSMKTEKNKEYLTFFENHLNYVLEKIESSFDKIKLVDSSLGNLTIDAAEYYFMAGFKQAQRLKKGLENI